MAGAINIRNKKAKFEYEFLESYTAGIQLLGTEIKSIRESKASIVEAYCVIVNNEVFIRNMYIQEYKNASFETHQIRRDRKLLLNRTEINKIDRKLKLKGLALIPYKMFISPKGHAKIEIKLAQGKKTHDKRQDLKDKDDKREMDRKLKNF